MRFQALTGLLMLAGCASAPPHLEPIPVPPPIIVKVPEFVALPAGSTTPCPKPQARAIRTDVDLLQAADAMKVWGQCNVNKLKAIEQAQPTDVAP